MMIAAITSRKQNSEKNFSASNQSVDLSFNNGAISNPCARNNKAVA